MQLIRNVECRVVQSSVFVLAMAHGNDLSAWSLAKTLALRYRRVRSLCKYFYVGKEMEIDLIDKI